MNMYTQAHTRMSARHCTECAVAVGLSSLQIVPMLDAQFKVAELEEAVRDVYMQSLQSTPHALFRVFEHRPHDSPMRTEHSVINCVLVKLQQWRCAHTHRLCRHLPPHHLNLMTLTRAWYSVGRTSDSCKASWQHPMQPSLSSQRAWHS